MNYGSYVGIFLVIFVIIMQENMRKRKLKYFLLQKMGGIKNMDKIITTFIDKEVQINTIDGKIIYAKITTYSDGWLMYENEQEGKGEIALNCAYITDIKVTDYFEKLRVKKAKKLAKASK